MMVYRCSFDFCDGQICYIRSTRHDLLHGCRHVLLILVMV
uniref:T.aestivum DNA sequence of ultraminichromosome (pTA637) n=1 Tax=Triticum aestivum TaxID=4565 RepID=Q41588_WHEAT|nr:unnamed protein product [Triticum aestivum]